MHRLSDYAVLVTLVVGFAGVLVFVVATAKQHSRRGDREVSIADTVAVLCFAMAAVLGVMGLVQLTRGLAASSATQDTLRERLAAVERRLETAEARLAAPAQASLTAPAPKAWNPVFDSPPSDPGRESSTAAPPAPAPRPIVPKRPPAESVRTVAVRSATSAAVPQRERTLAEHTADGWDALKRDVRRGGDDWRDAWHRLRRAFAD